MPDLGQTEIDLTNEVKQTAVLVDATGERVEMSASVDKQWAEVARVHLQQGLALDRAVAKPNRFCRLADVGPLFQ